MTPIVPADVRAIARSGESQPQARAFAAEVPVSVEINGIGYAVMMMTPQDLEDFAVGFCLADQLIDTQDDIEFIEPFTAEMGIILRIGTRKALASRLDGRVRSRTSDSSCGLCGVESLEQALRPLPKIPAPVIPQAQAVFDALDALKTHQPLSRETGAVHGAAAISVHGQVRLVREDVGRHNAFDKLIGAMARTGMLWEGGFALLTSRCSYELVEKAVLAQCPGLATISLPTSLAAQRAKDAGLPLAVLARPDQYLAL